MFDEIRKLAEDALEAGLAYQRHCGAIDTILMSPTLEAGVQAVRDYVVAIETDEDYLLFQSAIVQQYRLAEQAQANSDTAWGTSFEDRLAYRMAKLGAGESAGDAAARQRLESLQALYQLAEHFRSEAKRAGLPAAADPGTAAR